MLLDPQQMRTLRGWQLAGAALSFTTCLFAVFNIFTKLCGGGCLKAARPPNELRPPLRPFRFLDRMILVLFIFDVLEAGTMLLTPAAFEFRQACEAQAFFEVWMETCIIQWNVLLSVYSWMVVRRRAVQRLEANLFAVLSVVVGLGLSLATVLYLQNKLGNAVVNCWIRQEHMAEQFLYFFLPLFTAWLIICAIAIRVCVLLQRQLGDSSQPQLMQGSLGVLFTRVRRQAMMYSACFITVWIIPLISRTMLLTGHTPPWALIVAHSTSMTLLGFLDALVYGQVTFNWLGLRAAGLDRRLSSSSSAQDSRRSSSVSVSHSLAVEHKEAMGMEEGNHHPSSVGSELSAPCHSLHHSHHLQQHVRHPWATGFHTLPIFVTTWNMGTCEASSLSDVSAWIPGRSAGYHTIVVGTQECSFLRGLRRAIWRHLGGPESYAMYAEEIGSAQINGHIALTVWVRADDVMSGCAERVRSAKTELAGGANLIITRAANKGAVAMAIRYHGCTTVGFVCCHLQADKDGRHSRARERERQLSDILSEVALSPEENGFDVHLQVHHLFLLGDLNFRLGLPSVPAASSSATGATGDVEGNVWTAADVLKGVHDASLGRGENWRDWAYRPLLLGTRPLPLDDEGTDRRARADREQECFDHLLCRDELREAVNEGRALHGFVEAGPIDFPPTYRTRKDYDMGDYDELSDLSWGYGVTTTNELNVRRPSYTDRILVHSLPTRALDLSPQSYQSCDAMLGSDHHPVSFHANVTVPLEPDDSHSHNINGQVEVVKVRLKLLVLGVHFFEDNGAKGGSYSGSEGPPTLSGAPSCVSCVDEDDSSSTDTCPQGPGPPPPPPPPLPLPVPVPVVLSPDLCPPAPPSLAAAAAPPGVPSAAPPKPHSLSMLRSSGSATSLGPQPTSTASWLPTTQVSVLFPIPVENTALRLGGSPSSSSQRGDRSPCVKSLSFEAAMTDGLTLEASTYRRTHTHPTRRAVPPQAEGKEKGDVMPLHAVLSVGGGKGRGGQGVLDITGRADREEVVTLTRGGRRVGEVRVSIKCRVRGETVRASKGDRPPRRSGGSGDGTMKIEQREGRL